MQWWWLKRWLLERSDIVDTHVREWGCGGERHHGCRQRLIQSSWNKNIGSGVQTPHSLTWVKCLLKTRSSSAPIRINARLTCLPKFVAKINRNSFWLKITHTILTSTGCLSSSIMKGSSWNKMKTNNEKKKIQNSEGKNKDWRRSQEYD